VQIPARDNYNRPNVLHARKAQPSVDFESYFCGKTGVLKEGGLRSSKPNLGAASSHHRCFGCCANYFSGMRAWSQSPMPEAEGLSRLHNTIADWPDSGYTRKIPFVPGAVPPWP